MAFVLNCRVFKVGADDVEVPVGFKKLRIPKITSRLVNIYGDSWRQVANELGSSTFDSIQPGWWQADLPFYCPDPQLEINVFLGSIDLLLYAYAGVKSIIYEIIGTNPAKRIVLRNFTPAEPNIGINLYNHTMVCDIYYMLGSTEVFHLNAPIGAYGASYNINYSLTKCQMILNGYSIPWACMGTDGELTFGSCTINCGYIANKTNGDQDDPVGSVVSATIHRFASQFDSFITWLGDYEPTEEVDPDNPYSDGGTSGTTQDTEGWNGDGNFSDDSDMPITDDLPSISAVGTGMTTIFRPSISQLRALSNLFWNADVFSFLQNLVENITNMFVSLAMVPFNVTAGATVSVTWLGIDTAISLTLAAKQFYEFDMGSINLGNDSRIFTSGSALDYSPFSTLGIYLPFIGYRDLDVDECRGAVLNLRYRIDILSGACVAIIKVDGRDIYEFTGNCLTQIPITNETMQSLVSDAVNVGLALSGTQAAGAVAGAAEADAIAAGETLTEEKSAHLNQMVGRSRGQLASATANAAMGMKPSFAKTGAVSGSVAMMSVKQPYLFLKTPRQSIPDHYQRYCGFPSNISGRLGEFSGYTVVEDIRLNGLVATSPEVAEIYKLLKSGVII